MSENIQTSGIQIRCKQGHCEGANWYDTAGTLIEIHDGQTILFAEFIPQSPLRHITNTPYHIRVKWALENAKNTAKNLANTIGPVYRRDPADIDEIRQMVKKEFATLPRRKRFLVWLFG